jgi:hypothetical protein
MTKPFATALILVGLLAPRAGVAVTLGQVDDFEDGTTQGWVVGTGIGASHPAPPANIPTNGPAGDGDHFLLLTSLGGNGAGSRLTALNPDQWGGDYVAAGVTGIAMDVRNFGNTDLALRLLFEDPASGPPSNEAVSSFAISLPASGDWTHVVFPITPGDLTAVFGSTGAALSNATVLRIYHGTTASFPSNPIVAQLGVDGIRAVPEPAPTALLAFAIAGLAIARCRLSPPASTRAPASPRAAPAPRAAATHRRPRAAASSPIP